MEDLEANQDFTPPADFARAHWLDPGGWEIGGTGFGEMLPRHENRIWIDESTTDRWGLPVLAIDCELGENERLMRVDMMNDMAEMLEEAGVRNVSTFEGDYAPGMGIHEMGTARMAGTPGPPC